MSEYFFFKTLSETRRRKKRQELDTNLWSQKLFLIFVFPVDEKVLIIFIGLRERATKKGKG